MPRYFFNIHDGQNTIDREGTELADEAQARSGAVELAGRSILEMGNAFWNREEGWLMEVCDATGKVLFGLKVASER